MKVFLALLALSGWALAIAFRVIATREQKRRMFAELTPTHSEHIPLLPVDAILDSLPLGVVVVVVNSSETLWLAMRLAPVMRLSLLMRSSNGSLVWL
jgi:hypothetical protein